MDQAKYEILRCMAGMISREGTVPGVPPFDEEGMELLFDMMAAVGEFTMQQQPGDDPDSVFTILIRADGLVDWLRLPERLVDNGSSVAVSELGL